jgi:hypothetical protein
MSQSVPAVVFVDANISNIRYLVESLLPGVRFFVLDAEKDGIAQISDYLQHQQLAPQALHIVAHGVPGCLFLGNTELSLGTLAGYGPAIQTWFGANEKQPFQAPKASHQLYLYGCNVAAGDAGKELLTKLHRLTGATLHASTEVVGGHKAGGTWQLNKAVGHNLHKPSQLPWTTPFLESYAGTFNNPPVGSLEPFAEFEKLTASDAAAGDRLGYSIDLSGTTAIIGAYQDGGVGSAYIYEFDGTNWVQTQQLTAPAGAATDDNFGWSVGISGATAIVGSRSNDTGGSNRGSVYIYEFNGANWVQTQQLQASDAANEDAFGTSVAISGNVAIVGAEFADNGASNTGSAYIFEYNGTDWVQTAELIPGDLNIEDKFGFSVAISGTTAIVGAFGDDDIAGNSGSAYIFEYNGSNWVQTAKLNAGDAEAGALFGYSVAISGNTAIVGARSDDHNGVADSGSAYIFQFDGNTWVQTAKLNASDVAVGDFFGVSVALDGSTAIVGAIADDDSGINSGSAYVFEFDGNGWSQTNKLTASDAASLDNFGIAVDVSDTNVLVGSYLDDFSGKNDSGSVYAFNALRNAPVTIDGTPVEDGELTVNTTDLVDLDGLPASTSYSYQWQQFNGSSWINIAEATASTFTPGDAQAGQPVRVQVIYTDLGSTTETVSSPEVVIANINDAPTAANNTITTAEDTPYALMAEDFNFADVDAGDSLQAVRITALPTSGTLRLSGNPISANAEISVDAITAGDLTFLPDPDENGTDYASFSFQVSDGTAFSAEAYTITANVTAEPDPPTASNSSILGVEDTPYSFKAADFKFVDPDAGDTLQTVKIVSLPTNGTLTLFGDAIAAGTEISLLDIDANRLQFIPGENANGTGYATFNFQVSDGTSFSTNAYTLTVNLTPVNDAPTASDSTVTATEDAAYAFSASDFNFADVDLEDSLETVRITTLPTTGTLTLSGSLVNAGAEISISDITAGNLRFVPLANENGNDYASFGFQVSDGELFSTATYTLTVDVTPANDPPTAVNGTITAEEDTAYSFAASDFGFADIDTGDTLQAVRITSLPTAGSLSLNGSPLAENAEVTIADIQAGALTYTPAADDNGPAYTTIGFQVSDGELFSTETYTLTVDVTPVNDAPTSADGAIETTEDTVYSFTAADFSFADVDEGDNLQVVRITNLPTDGSLTLNGLPVSENAEIPIADIIEGNLQYLAEPNANGAGYTTLNFQVGDGELFSTETYSLTVNVAAVNDAPTAENNTVIAEEDTPYTFMAVDFNFADVDAGDSLQAIRIATLPAVGQLLLLGSPVAEAAEFTVEAIESGALQFVPAENENGENYAAFNFQVSDGELFSTNTYTLSVNVTPVNDAPTAADGTITTDEDIAYALTVADFNFADIDVGDSLEVVRITAMPTLGTLTLNGNAVTVDTEIAVADIEAGNLTYTPGADENGTAYDSFGFQVGDGEAFSTAAYTLTVDVTPVADPPTATNNTITFEEDTTYQFAVGDFNFADVDAGDSLQFVSVTSLPTQGSLTLSGLPVTENVEIPVSDIQEGSLVFTPDPDANGEGYASFDFRVSDGTFFSTETYTLALDITPVADAPTAADSTVTALEDTAYSFSAADFNFADADQGDSLQVVQFTTLPTDGSLTLNGEPVTTNTDITIEDITAGNLQFTAAPDANGSGYASFGFRVSDGTFFSAETYTLTVDVTPVADPPTAADSTVTIDEDTPYSLAVADFNFADPDEGDSLQEVQLITLPAAGSLTLNGLPVSVNDSISVGDLVDGNLVFTPAPDANGVGYASFDFQVSDGIFFNNDTYTLTVDVTPVADAPTTEDSTVTTDEDVPYTFTEADFNFADADAGDTLQNVQFITLPNQGSLTLAGLPVLVNQTITVSEIAAGNLQFAPDPETSGENYANFDFRVNDGSFFSDNATLTVNVTSVEDAPTTTDQNITIEEDSAYTFTEADFSFADADTDDSLQFVQFTTLPAAGSLTLDGLPVSAEQIIAVSDIIEGNLQFTPAPDENGTGYASFNFQVSDGSLLSAPATFVVDVTPVNDAPQFTMSPPIVEVFENVASGTVVYSAAATDVDGDPLTYSIISGNESGVFAINPTNGDVVVADSSLLDVELPSSPDSFTLGIQVSDGNDAAALTDTQSLTLVPLDANEHSDFNGDGFADIIWRDTANGKNYVWYLENGVPAASIELLSVEDPNYSIAGTGDFDADGKEDDLVWLNTGGGTTFWFTEFLFSGSAVVDGSNALPVVGDSWDLQGVGDFDGDGYQDDLFWYQASTRNSSIWYTDNGQLVGGGAVAATQSLNENWAVSGVGDFDADGLQDDLIWRNQQAGINIIWLMDGTTAMSSLPLQNPGSNWSLGGVSDFDGDSIPDDLLWRNTSTGVLSIWFMEGNALTGGISNIQPTLPTTFEVVV